MRRVISEEIPYFYACLNRRHKLILGQKPDSLPKNKIVNQREMRHHRHIESYVNPIEQAREYARMMKDFGLTQTALAKKLGVSRARVTQILNLLRLPPGKQDHILKHGKTNKITERKLRHETTRES